MNAPGLAALRIFEAVAASPPEQRDTVLAELCGADFALRQAVELLLDFDLAAADDEPGTSPQPLSPQVPGYEILAEIGRGAHGVVYLARQAQPPRAVALKVLPNMDRPSAQQRFAVETAALARLNHPGIAQVFDVGLCDAPLGRFAYVAMELVAGGRPLLAYLEAVRPPLRTRIELLARTADALDHAHQRGVLHRDLKPDNILVVAHDDQPAPKLVDFGVAQIEQRAGAAGGFAGTVAYCAPEHVLGAHAEWSARSDEYSLGVVAYETLSGRLPVHLRGLALPDAVARLGRADAVPLAAVDPRLRGDLDAIVMKAIARDPAARYPSAREFAADLRCYLRREPVAARGGGVLYRAACLFRRRPARVSGLLALGLLSAVSVLAWVERHAQTRWGLDIIGTVLSTAIDRLDHLRGTAASRAACLDDLLAEVGPVASALPRDPKVLAVQANLLRARGHVARDIGDFKAALVWRQRGLAAREAQFAVESTPAVLSELAQDLVLQGDVFADTGDFAAAEAWYVRAHEMFARLAASQPDDRRSQDDLGCSFDRLAALRSVVGGSGAAAVADLLAERAKVNEVLARIAPDHLATLLGRATWQGLMAERAAREGDAAGALLHLRARVASASALLARFPEEKLSAVQAIDAANRLAGFATTAGLHAEARAALEDVRALAQAVRASSEDPGQWEALNFVLVDATVALAEGRNADCERLARSVVEAVAAKPSARTAWLQPVAEKLVGDATHRPR